MRFGSSLFVTICGRDNESQREGGMGAQIRPEVYRIMKAIFSVVMSWAAMMRSPSFSREGSSRTMMKLPFPAFPECVSGRCREGWDTKGKRRTECGDCVFY